MTGHDQPILGKPRLAEFRPQDSQPARIRTRIPKAASVKRPELMVEWSDLEVPRWWDDDDVVKYLKDGFWTPGG